MRFLKLISFAFLLFSFSCDKNKFSPSYINLTYEQVDVLFVSLTEGSQQIFAVKDSFPNEVWNISYSYGQYGNADPAWSPDGRKFAFTDVGLAVNGVPVFANIFIRNMDQDTSANDSNVLRLMTYSALVYDSNQTIVSTAINARPDWNPVYSKLVFISNRDSIFNIFVTRISVDLKGDTVPVRLTDQTDKIDFFTNPSWSPDGNYIIYNCSKSGHQEIWRMNDDGSGKTQLTSTNASTTSRARYSPMGDKIAFFSSMGRAAMSDSLQIYTIDPNGSNLDTVTTSGNNYQPAWSPDGTKIIYAKQTGSRNYIYIINRDGTGEERFINDSKAFYPIWRMKP